MNPIFDVSAKSPAYNDLYNYNYHYYVQGGYPFRKMEIYHWVYNNLLETGEDLVTICS